MNPLIVMGEDLPCGAYALRLGAAHDLHLQFGRFQGGKTIAIPAGDYIYVGSAMGRKGASRLAARLIRHATRTAGKAPHAIRAALLERFPDGAPPRRGKTLAWNVDYLLDELAVSIDQIYLLRAENRLETAIAEYLLTDSHTSIIEKGLGANDVPGHTHLLRVEADEAWWTELANYLTALAASA